VIDVANAVGAFEEKPFSLQPKYLTQGYAMREYNKRCMIDVASTVAAFEAKPFSLQSSA
jgi:hypothetical protein